MKHEDVREQFTDWYDSAYPEDKHQDCAIQLAFEAYDAALKASDERLAGHLISNLSLVRGRPVEWSEAIEITAIITGMPDDEKQRLLAMDGI